MEIERKILPCEAAKLLNKSNLFVYEAMKRVDQSGKPVLDIGAAMRMPGRTKWTFSISPSKLAKYLGIDIATLNERLSRIRGERKQDD